MCGITGRIGAIKGSTRESKTLSLLGISIILKISAEGKSRLNTFCLTNAIKCRGNIRHGIFMLLLQASRSINLSKGDCYEGKSRMGR